MGTGLWVRDFGLRDYGYGILGTGFWVRDFGLRDYGIRDFGLRDFGYGILGYGILGYGIMGYGILGYGIMGASGLTNVIYTTNTCDMSAKISLLRYDLQKRKTFRQNKCIESFG